MLYWIYTGTTQQEAEQKAQTNLDLVNAVFVGISGDPWTNLQTLTANPVIESDTYYFGFQKPPSQFNYGDATYDLETEFSSDWFIQEEI